MTIEERPLIEMVVELLVQFVMKQHPCIIWISEVMSSWSQPLRRPYISLLRICCDKMLGKHSFYFVTYVTPCYALHQSVLFCLFLLYLLLSKHPYWLTNQSLSLRLGVEDLFVCVGRMNGMEERLTDWLTECTKCTILSIRSPSLKAWTIGAIQMHRGY